MHKLIVSSLALAGFGLLLSSPAAALSVTITGPTDIWVPFGECVNASWSASTSGTVETYDWAFDGSLVSSTSSYSRTFCSPGLDYATSSDHTLEIWVEGGGQADYDSHHVHVIYQAGDENGDCGFQIVCDP